MVFYEKTAEVGRFSGTAHNSTARTGLALPHDRGKLSLYGVTILFRNVSGRGWLRVFCRVDTRSGPGSGPPRTRQNHEAAAKRPRGHNGRKKVMKVRASVKRRCEFCQIIKRHGKIRVICSRDARHKQCQG